MSRTLASNRSAIIATTNTDNFNRSDSTTSLGSTDQGKLWTALSGTWGIQSNRAYVASGGLGIAVFNTGIGDYTSLKAIVNMPLGNQGGLVFRATDVNNYLRFVASQGTPSYTITKVSGGVGTTLITISQSVAIDDEIIQVILRGPNIKCFYNSIQIFNYDLSASDYALFPTTKTLAGIIKFNSGSNLLKFDDLEANMALTPRTLAVGRTLSSGRTLIT